MDLQINKLLLVENYNRFRGRNKILATLLVRACTCLCVHVCMHVHFPIIPAHGRLRKENHKFEASFGHIVRLCQKKGWGRGVEDPGEAGRESDDLEHCFLSMALLVLCFQYLLFSSLSCFGPKVVFVYPLNALQIRSSAALTLVSILPSKFHPC